MPHPKAFTLLASGAKTSTGNGDPVDLTDEALFPDKLTRRAARLLFEVTVVSGTGIRLELYIETSPNATSWKEVLRFEDVAAVGFQRLCCAGLERYVRARWVIVGASPSFTVQVTGDAEVVYADPEDFFALGLPERAVGDENGVTSPVDLLARCIIAASSVANAKIPRAYMLPLKWPFPDSLKKAVCEIAALKLISQRGYDPDDQADKEIKTNADGATEWLDELGGGTVPDWIDATPEVFEGGAAVVSAPLRGW